MKSCPLSYSRHAEDSGVEIQGFNRIFNPQHSLLHHEILQHRNPITKLYINTHIHTKWSAALGSNHKNYISKRRNNNSSGSK